MSLVKINKVLDDILGRRFGIEGEAVSAERQLIIDVLMDFYKNDKDEFFVTESLAEAIQGCIQPKRLEDLYFRVQFYLWAVEGQSTGYCWYGF